jgi:hypothetical protein
MMLLLRWRSGHTLTHVAALLWILCSATTGFAAAPSDVAVQSSTVSSAQLPDAPLEQPETSAQDSSARLPAPQILDLRTPLIAATITATRLSGEPGLSFDALNEELGTASRTSAGAETGTANPASPILTTPELDAACQSGRLRGKPCRASWWPILWETFQETASQNVGNIALDDETRHDLRYNPYWSTYFQCVRQFRYDQWRDDDDFMVDYIGHGMQGAITSFIYEQHAPSGRGEVYVNNRNYWMSRLRGMAWIAVYEVQWKLGPAGEASIGNSGLNSYYTPRVQGRTTNETGFQDLVDTPVVGFWWTVGEDAIDRFVMPRIWKRTHNKWILSAVGVITPCKSAANLVRYKPPYYRDFAITPLR